MPTSYEPGATVEVRGETWRLAHSQRFGACTVLTLEGRDRSNAGTRLRVIDPFDRPRFSGGRRMRRRPRRAVLTAALNALVSSRPRCGLWSAANASLSLWPYQLEPALAVLRGATRLLLADAVGLGKTVQAGLILAELRERAWISHAVIVCPAGLRDSWRRELHERFGIAAAVLDQSAIASRVAELPPGVSPWTGHAVAIASIDFIKRAEVLAAIAAEPIDLLIVDEAHHLAPGTDRAAAIARLAARSPWCVFASATPHSGDRAAFDYLTSMGAAGDSISIFRRRRSDVGLAVARRTHLLPVQPLDAERKLLDAVTTYAAAIWLARGRDDHAVKLVASTLARRAASSPNAIVRTLTRRLALLSGVTIEPSHPSLPWEEEDASDDNEPDAVLSARGFEDGVAEVAFVERLLDLARQCPHGAKMRRIERVLAAIKEPAVIFTEYRDTLDAIVTRLAALHHRVGAIHGGLAPELRRMVVDAFNGGRIDVLVATDAAGEGLNLHQCCRLVIDNELPWNPLRLEQRVGRVDRLGQRRTVHAIRLFHPDSIEQRVLERLRLRSRRAEDALNHNVSESDLAAAVFDAQPLAPSHTDIRSEVVPAAIAECDRLRRQRRLGGAADITRVWTAPRHRRPVRIIALFRTRFINEAGCVVDEQLHARTLRSRHGAWREVIEHLAASVGTLGSADTSGNLDSLSARISTIRVRLEREHATRYQRSLFDARADAHAAARQLIVSRLDAALHRTLTAAASPVSLAATRTELVAAWPERP